MIHLGLHTEICFFPGGANYRRTRRCLKKFVLELTLVAI